MKNKKFYITTSIAYTNALPHIGYALEIVQADVLARYHRILSEDVFFLTGTDEHGKKVSEAAEKAGKTPEEFTDEISEEFRKLTEVLNLSNNDFIRTTDKKRHWPNVEKLWKELEKNEDIYKKKYQGLYCVGCEAFVKEKDLADGKCPIHLKKPELIEEENYFFKLSKYADKVKKAIQSDEIKITPEARKNEIISFIDQGIEDTSCSRSKENLKWGIPVPGDNSQVIYIWFEALINYLFPEKYWPADIHCVGKDIFRFHALLWPAMLIASKRSLPKNILVHGFITVAGQKISKSLGNVIDPFELVKKYGTDPVRYFLLREILPTEDGDFTYEKFEQRYNSDLAKGLGNLVARVITMAAKSKIQNPKSKINSKFKIQINKTKNGCKKALSEFKFNETLMAVWELISYCDKYIEEKKPWSFDSAQDKEKSEEVIGDLLSAIKEIAELLKPFLPETSEKIMEQIKTKKSQPLFPRLDKFI
ncbi:MAG: methionine--tRNA ligase [bacterium]|nr:methionine--tRNA ligase [bacterium]